MSGRFLARVEGPVSGNVLLRREQYRVMDDGPSCTRIARGIVTAKALNQRSVLQRALRDHGPALADPAREALSAAIDRMQDIARRALYETDLDRLRGHEGEVAALYMIAVVRWKAWDWIRPRASCTASVPVGQAWPST